MNPIAMMMPMVQTAKMETTNKQMLSLKGGTQNYSNFSDLLQEQGKALQVQSGTVASDSDKSIPATADEMIEELLKLEMEELDEMLTALMEKPEISDEDLSLLEEMKGKLLEMQQYAAESPEEVNHLSIVEPVVRMGTEQLFKDMIAHFQQPEFQEYVARILPIGDVRIIERINEDGTLVLRPLPSEGEDSKNQIQPVAPFIDFNKMQQDAKQILTQVESMLNNIQSLEEVPRIAPKMLELLQQWQKLIVQSGPDADKQFSHLNIENKQLATVWKQVVQAYQNRVSVQSQSSYNLDAKVTTNDVVRWLSNAMETVVQTERTAPVQQAPAAPSLPISKVEQFVIHINQPQQSQAQTQTQPVDKQLVEQFQKIMDANRITHLQNGRGQIAITLKPHNLGEMLVRFTQVNGEMMVKILVTSESAQKMLEGNMQQLRSMFSPHQVVIDRQEAILTGNQESQKHQERNGEQGTRDEAHSEEQEQQPENESFSNIFEELIVNEEV